MAEHFVIEAQRQRKTYHQRRTASDTTYKQLHRFERQSVEWMAGHFLGNEHFETRGGALTNMQRMEITLRYLADPGFQTGVAHDVGIHQTTVSKTVKNVLSKVIDKKEEWICFPMTSEDIALAKQKWQDKLGFPSTIGAIDCTHIRIEKPAGNFGDEFVNRKGYASINVQATCNEQYVFTSVDTSWPGSVHDSRIFKNSAIYQLLLNGYDRSVLLGDEGYGITPFLMPPYRDPVTAEERNFNKVHCKNRVTIEQSFGQLKRRFPILRYGIRLQQDTIPVCIMACFILHNISKYLHDDSTFDNEQYQEDLMEYMDNDENLNPNQLKIRGEQRRAELMGLL